MQAKTKEETVSMPCKSETRALALSGLRDAVPVGLGYLAVSFSLGIVAYAVAWIVGSRIYNLKGYDSLFFGVAAGGMGLFLVGIAFLFVYIFYVAGKGKHYDNIFWIMIWLTQTVGMVMFAAPSIAEKVV